MKIAKIAGLAALFSGVLSHAENISLTTGMDYSSGKYGGTSSTDILYIPFTGKYETGKWIYKLTVPYISITGPGNVVNGIGQVTTPSAVRTTQSGLGDVVAGATYNLINSPSGTVVDATGKIKFGTADKNKGLGTGKNDYALQTDIYRTIGSYTAFGTIGYRVFGKPSGYALNNVFYGSIGGLRKLGDKTSGGLVLDLRQQASPLGAPLRELTAFLTQKFDAAWKGQLYVVKGYGVSSPDWGGGAMLTRTF